MHIKQSLEKSRIMQWYGRQNHTIQTIIFFMFLSLPIIAYCTPFLLTGTNLAPGDADYLMQTEEAAYQSIIKYGQFPWWNPWVSGGVPLFANPQFGLISLPTLCALLFGSIIGYKVALSLYILLAFWGVYLLTRKALGTHRLTAILLGYIWAFSGYFALRIAGHFTFFTIAFFPFILFVFIKQKSIKGSWAILGLLIGLMINAAAHNTSIMALAVFSLFVIAEVIKICIKIWKSKQSINRFKPLLLLLRFLSLSMLVTLIVSGQRLFYSLEYVKEYPRALFSTDETIGLIKGLFALFGPLKQYHDQLITPEWSWMEAGSYIGFFTGVAAIISLLSYFKIKGYDSDGQTRMVYQRLVIGLGILFFLFGLGMFAGSLSPYFILHHLPVFSSMRVATRWFVWAALMVVLFIATNNTVHYRKIINACLFISVVELFVFGSPYLGSSYTIPVASYRENSTINQQVGYDTKRYGIFYDENLTATTKSNIGQIVAGDSLLDTRQGPPVGISTIRCDSDNSCPFVLTNNAKIEKWSPNKIVLSRTGNGVIKLNMNPGKYWLVNGKYIFSYMRLAEPGMDFAINDGSEKIVLQLQPKYSLGWLAWKIEKIF